MNFYDREKEIEILRRNWERSEKQSLFTVMVGRRRIGKTSLLLQTEKEQKMLYLYVSKDNERVLVEKFQGLVEKVLGLHVYFIHHFISTSHPFSTGERAWGERPFILRFLCREKYYFLSSYNKFVSNKFVSFVYLLYICKKYLISYDKE